jgi:hypothetical protein
VRSERLKKKTTPNSPLTVLTGNDGFEKFAGLAVFDFLGMNSPYPIRTFRAGDGPAETAVVRVGRTALHAFLTAAHPFPALLLAFEFHRGASPVFVLILL